MDPQILVGISEACQILKVSETALRQWTDEGKIKAFVTPGGHRRYLVEDLKDFMSTSHKAIGIKELIAEIEDTVHLHREIALRFYANAAWYSQMSGEYREQLSLLGRNLLSSIIVYITDTAEQENTLKKVREIGKGFGLMLAKIGLPLTDSVEAFIMHKDPIINVTTKLMKKREAFSGRVIDSIPLVARVMDEALVSLVAEHQLYSNNTPGQTDGNKQK